MLWNQDKIIRPVLQNEINKLSDQHFGQIKPTITDESIFKLKFPKQYNRQMSRFWINFIAAKMMTMQFVGKFLLDSKQGCIYSNWFRLTRISQTDLLFTYSHEANRNYISKLIFEITEYTAGVYNIMIGEKFYISRLRNQVLFGPQADLSYIAENTKYYPN